MSEAYLGEIRLFAGNFAPVDWAFCNGQLLNISQNTALYTVIGTQYGGDGVNTFALPNLSGCAPMNQGSGQGLTPRTVGQQIGSATVTLDTTNMPTHSHTPQAVTNATPSTNTASASGAYWAQYTPPASTHPHPVSLYNTTPDVQMSPYALALTGNSQPHNNMQPYLALNFIICLSGVFPIKSS